MCGIAGFVGHMDPAFLETANRIQAHRGPDDTGVFFDAAAGVGLAHRRLSIIDTSSGGHQPMTDPVTGTVIVFNGEIYNFLELRRELMGKGHTFHSDSDTEVLLRLYAEFGERMINRLNGIFAFALWDRQRQTLLLVRDPFGVKPLYYTQTAQGLAFASELKSLLSLPGLDRTLNLQALTYYMAYLWCPAPQTPLKRIRKLLPGHYLKVTHTQTSEPIGYYDIPFSAETRKKTDPINPIKTVETAVYEAVRRQLIADVPVGAFLSGGLDSSTIVAMAKKAGHVLPCFTIRYQTTSALDGFADDFPYAQQVARYLDVPLHVVDIRPEDMIGHFSQMVYFLDEPQADPAPINVRLISRLARQHGMKVLLSGAGGDDIFTGYRRHLALQTEALWGWVPGTIRDAVGRAVSALPQRNATCRRLAKAFRHAGLPAEDRLLSYFLWTPESTLLRVLHPDIRNRVSHDFMDGLRATQRKVRHLPSLHQMLYMECKHFLADHNLNYTDKMGMAEGVEIRVPFLDVDLVNAVAQLPPDLKIQSRTLKYLLKAAMTDHLPAAIIHRPKTGFGAPIREWLSSGPLHDQMQDLLSPASLGKRNLFDSSAVKSLIQKTTSANMDGSYLLLSMMCIEWWCRHFLDTAQS